MANVNINIRKDEVKKDGEVPIIASFSVNGKQKHLRLSETFPLAKIVGKEFVAGRDIILNEKAKRIRAKASLIEIELEKGRTANVPDLFEYVKLRLAEETDTEPKAKKERKIDFFALWEEWELHNNSRVSNQTSELISKGTKKNYNTVKNHLKEFHKKHPIDIANIGRDFYSSFSNYVINDCHLTPNTFGMYIKIFKTFMSWADEVLEERGVDIMKKYLKFKVVSKYKGIDHLTSTDLVLFQEFKTDKKHLRTACDLFLMMCYTGLSVSDLLRLRSDFEYNESRMMLTKRKKTDNECVIPLFDDQVFKPVALLTSYNWKLPYMPDSKINKYIKDIAKAVGFERFLLTTRIGRKTFATIKHLEHKVPSHIVMRATGHKTEKNFLKYIGTDHAAIIGGFEDGAQYLKVV